MAKSSDDSGSTALYFVVIASAMIFAAAVVIDGGRKMSSLAQAVHLADNGARACAQAVDEQAILGSNRTDVPTLNQTEAAGAAAAYFLQAGVSNYQVAFDDTGTRCLVTVTLDVPSIALPMGEVRATESAVGEAG